MRRVFIFFAACFFCVALISCRPDNDRGENRYTYRTTSTSPSTWNPAEYKLGDEATVISFTSSALYEFVISSNPEGYELICELASDFPQDVSALYGREEGIAWLINLNPLATWDDGTPITAYTYEYSVKQYLNPQMKNYRASSWYQDTLALSGAQAYYEGKSSWSDVGFIVNGEHSFTLILSKPQTLFFVEYGLTNPFLLHERLFEANKKETGGLVKTSYGTSIETSASCGPYKISRYQADKSMHFVRNESWYGWSDGRHENLYQTTDIDLQFITDHNTIINLFLQGKIDDVGLDANDLQKYGNSDYRYDTPLSYTWKLSFNIDKESLKKEEVPGINHSIISYVDFRHALSLALDRQKYVNTISPASDVGLGLINYSYVCDPETGELYRESEQAKRILCEIYDTQNVEDITGYDIDKARALMQRAYDKAFSNGDIKAGDKVQVDYHTYNTSDTNTNSVAFMQDAFNEASKGTSLEGRINVKMVTDENYYTNMKNGAVDVAMTGWGGSTFDPYGILWCYADADALNEYGFDPYKETVTINLDGKNITKSYNAWYIALCEGEYVRSDMETRKTILAECEKGLLLHYNMIPIRYWTSVSLNSHRILEGSEVFVNSLVGFGGLREKQFTMDDKDWDAYCERNNYQLTY